MAEIRDQYVLELTRAFDQIDALERRAADGLRDIPVDLDITHAQRQLETLDLDFSGAVTDSRLLEEHLQDAERAAEGISGELAEVEFSAERAEADFRDIAAALGSSEDEARDLVRQLLEAQQAANRTESAARDVARQMGLADREADEFARALSRSASEAREVDRAVAGIPSKLSGLRGAVGGLAGAFAAIGVGQLFSVAGRGIGAALGEFQALNESINAVKVTFEEGAGAVLSFGEVSAQSAGLSAQAFQQAVVPIGAVLTNFGFSAQEAGDAAVILVQRAADLASVFNTDVGQALLAINSAMVGQVEPLRRYGAEVSEVRVQAFALANGLVNANGEVGEQERVAARLQLILQDTAKVQGDFVNTSDELANAQRIARAEVEEFGASVGEVLAPAMASALTLLPPLLEGFRQLVPAIAGGAESAAAFFEASGKGGGFRAEGAGLAAFFDVVTAGGGIVANLGGIISGVGKDFLEFDGNLNNTAAAADRMNVVLEEPVRRGIAIKLAQALDAGSDAVETFGSALAATARSTKSLETFEKSYRDLAIAANLSQPQLQGATRQLLANRVALGLTAPEVSFLTGELNALNEELDTGGRANEDYRESMGGISDAVPPVLTALDKVRLAASEAGLSMGDLIAGTDPVAAALLRTLDPTERLRLKLEEVRSGAITMADAFRDRVTPSIFDASEALIDFSENGKVSTREWIRGLNEGVAAALTFRANLQTLFDLSPEVALIVAGLPVEEAMEQARLLIQEPQLIPLVVGAAQDLQGVAALQQQAVLTVIEMVREGLPEQTIADFIKLSSDPTTGFGPGFEDQLVAVWDFAVGGAQERLIGPDFTIVYVKAMEDVDTDRIEAITDKIFADLDPPSYPKPKFPPLSSVEVQREGDKIFNDLNPPTYPTPTLPDFTPVVTAAVQGTNTSEVTAAMDAALAVSFADLVPPEFTPLLATAFKAVDKASLKAEMERILDLDPIVNFFLSGQEARRTFMDGLSTAVSGETGRLRQSLQNTMNQAENRQSPPKLFLDYGIEAGETFWMGFDQSGPRSPLRVSDGPTGGSGSGTTTAEGSTGGGFTFAPTYVDTTTRDLETVVARSEQLMSSVAGILNGRFKL